MSAAAFTETGVTEGLLPAVGSVPPLTSLSAPVPPCTAIRLPVAAKLTVQLRLPPAATTPLGEHTAVGAPGKLAAFVT